MGARSNHTSLLNVLLILMAFGIVLYLGSRTIQQQTEVTPTVDFCYMLLNPEEFNNKSIRTTAVLHRDLENVALYDPQCDSKITYTWAEYDLPSGSEDRNRLEAALCRTSPCPTGKARVTVVGQFSGPFEKGYGHLNDYRFRFSIMHVEEAEALLTTEPAHAEDRVASQVTKEKAIAVASADAAKIYDSIGGYHPVVCEKTSLWVVVFDGGGFEYYIDKNSGRIVSQSKLPVTSTPVRSSKNSVNERRAIKIAIEHFGDFLESYGDPKVIVNDYDARPCELSNAWRVFFEYRPSMGQPINTLPNTNPPNYLIDKHTGKIVFTTHQIR